MDKILLVNKDKGYTSRDVVNILVKIFKTTKIGHFGTLDPLATGLLVIGIGKYTKIGNMLENDDKEYIAEVLVGTSTDSYDIEGNVINKVDIKSLNKDLVIETLNRYKGTYLQEVPIYSATKVNGKKLYEYARENKDVLLPKKLVNIKSIELIEIYTRNDDLYFSFKTCVSKGTYIRSLINDISKTLDIPMCMSNLKRTRQDVFNLCDAYSIDDIKNGNYKLLDIEDVFDVYIEEVDGELYKKVRNGVLLKRVSDRPILFKKDGVNVSLYVKSNDNIMRSFINYGG